MTPAEPDTPEPITLKAGQVIVFNGSSWWIEDLDGPPNHRQVTVEAINVDGVPAAMDGHLPPDAESELIAGLLDRIVNLEASDTRARALEARAEAYRAELVALKQSLGALRTAAQDRYRRSVRAREYLALMRTRWTHPAAGFTADLAELEKILAEEGPA